MLDYTSSPQSRTGGPGTEGPTVLEIELKCPVTNFDSVCRHLEAWGSSAAETLDETDHYFNAPDRDFARTDEALRVRCIGAANYATYKGPKRDAYTKTRTEIEVGLAPGPKAAEDFRQLLTHLAYRLVARVRKQRRIHRLEREGFELEICLDEVQGLGCFVEVEIQAPEEQLERAREVLLTTARALGLESSERRSYLEMLLERGLGGGVAAGPGSEKR
jgi:adenylate cyclase class 2